MIVSFDLDDTLFVSPLTHKTEKELPFPLNRLYKERLRKGTVSLIHALQSNGNRVYVYTTSYRSEHYIRNLFRHYGIKFDRIINGATHEKEVQGAKSEAMPSKYPSRYRIDLHIDDDKSVMENGKIYGFHVFLIGGQDDAWTEKILTELQRIQKLSDFWIADN